MITLKPDALRPVSPFSFSSFSKSLEKLSEIPSQIFRTLGGFFSSRTAHTLYKRATLLGLLCYPESARAQSTFFATFGGAFDDYVNSIAVNPQGTILTHGYTLKSGIYDVFLTMRYPNHTLAWSKKLNYSNHDVGYDVKFLPDGSFLTAGFAYSAGIGGYDAFLVKWSAAGDILWKRLFGGLDEDWFADMVTTPQGDMALTGYTNSVGAGNYDGLLVKLRSDDGTVVWARTAGGPLSDWFRALVLKSSGGFVCVGQTVSFGAGNGDVFVASWTEDGFLEWARTFGGNGYEVALGVDTDFTGSMFILSTTNSFGAGEEDVLLLKVEPNGVLTFAKTIGGAGSDGGYDLLLTPSGKIVVVGRTGSHGATTDAFLMQLDSEGREEWAKRWTGAGFNNTFDGSWGISLTPNGELAIGGSTYSLGGGQYDGFHAQLTATGDIPGCAYFQTITANVTDQTHMISSILLSLSGANWTNPTVQTWSNISVTDLTGLNQSILCLPPATTGVQTTGALTTGNPTTGVQTTGIATTGIQTTGVQTTGNPTTGNPTTGVQTTGIATTGIQTTGVQTTGNPTTGNPTTGVQTTGIATTGIQTTGVQTTGNPTTGAPTTGVSTSPSDTHRTPRSSQDDGTLKVGLITGFVALIFGLGAGIGIRELIHERRRIVEWIQRGKKRTREASSIDMQPVTASPLDQAPHEYQNASSLPQNPYGMTGSGKLNRSGPYGSPITSDHPYEHAALAGSSTSHAYENPYGIASAQSGQDS